MDGKIHHLLSYPDVYSLVIQPHLPFFMNTTRINIAAAPVPAAAAAPVAAPVAITDVKSDECLTTTE